jgi:hypothetical protein
LAKCLIENSVLLIPVLTIAETLWVITRMMRINCLMLFIGCFICSCSESDTENIDELNGNSSEFIHETIQNETLTVTSMDSIWENLSDIQEGWIKLERDSIGYLIVNPCIGNTPTIRLDSTKGMLHCNWGNGNTTNHNYQKYTRIKPNDALHIWAGDLVCNLEIKDPKRKLVLWSIRIDGQERFEWVMTPIEYKSEFRNINESCNEEEVFNLLPVEFTPKHPAE